MNAESRLILGEYVDIPFEVVEAAMIVFAYPANSSPPYLGTLIATASWHITGTNEVKVSIRIADIDVSNKVTYYENGVELGKSLSLLAGFDIETFQQAKVAIDNAKEGRFVCWRIGKADA